MKKNAKSQDAAADAKPAMPNLEQVTSGGTDSSGGSIDIDGFEFCANHGKEVCPDCGIDALEGNDFVAGIDPTPGRDGMEVAFTRNKNGEPVCKKHNSPKDGCFAFKKQIVKLSKEAAKSNKKNKKDTGSNLFA